MRSSLVWQWRFMRSACCQPVALVVVVSTLLLAVGVSTASRAAELGGDFSLTDHHGQPFHLSQLRGQHILLSFGFTHCPDICPLELATIAQTLRNATDKKLIGLFISLDPERDTVAKLAKFVPFFHESIVGLTGSPEQIQRVATQYGVRFSRHGDGDDYTIDHATGVHIIDASGKLRSVAPFGSTAGHLQQVLEHLLANN